METITRSPVVLCLTVVFMTVGLLRMQQGLFEMTMRFSKITLSCLNRITLDFFKMTPAYSKRQAQGPT